MTTVQHPAARTAVLEALEGALRAPSEHNVQPWRWTLHADRVDLALDEHRRLPFTDELDVGALLGCGAALHHLRVGLAARGWRTIVRRDEIRTDRWHLADVGWEPGGEVGEPARRLAEAIDHRRTDRRRFGARPVGAEILADLDRAARDNGALMHLVAGRRRHDLVAAMRAAALQQRDRPGYAAELQRWTHRHPGGADGLPSGVRIEEPHEYGDLVLRWFPTGRLEQPRGGQDHEDASALLVLCAVDGDTVSVLRAGEALSAVLLEATAHGLATTPITQVLEVDTTRALVRHLGDGEPVVVIRAGHPLPGAAPLPPTPRRPLESVLVDHGGAR